MKERAFSKNSSEASGKPWVGGTTYVSHSKI
jgi:hypothetical protein